jgi:hypothetical protein
VGVTGPFPGRKGRPVRVTPVSSLLRMLLMLIAGFDPKGSVTLRHPTLGSPLHLLGGPDGDKAGSAPPTEAPGRPVMHNGFGSGGPRPKECGG